MGRSQMSLAKYCCALYLSLFSLSYSATAQEFGRPATPAETQLWDIDVRPDGAGLPEGSGNAIHGKDVYDTNCAMCHGDKGVNGIKDPLVGGFGSLTTEKPIKTVGSYWPYATTLYDYIHRAMPYQAPGSLSTDDTYAVVAYILSLNGIIPEDGKIDKQTLPKIIMPNKDGFLPKKEFIEFKPSPAKPKLSN